MSDIGRVIAGINAAEREDRPIDDLTARIIAASWHSGQASAMYSFLSTGAIDYDRLEGELFDTMKNQPNDDDKTELDFLIQYVQFHGWRGPVNGWSDLNW